MDRAGHQVGHCIEHRAGLGGKETLFGAFDVEHAMQTLAVADWHQIFGAHGGIAWHVVWIGRDIGDQLRGTEPRATTGGAAGNRPHARSSQR